MQSTGLTAGSVAVNHRVPDPCHLDAGPGSPGSPGAQPLSACVRPFESGTDSTFGFVLWRSCPEACVLPEGPRSAQGSSRASLGRVTPRRTWPRLWLWCRKRGWPAGPGRTTSRVAVHVTRVRGAGTDVGTDDSAPRRDPNILKGILFLN